MSSEGWRSTDRGNEYPADQGINNGTNRYGSGLSDSELIQQLTRLAQQQHQQQSGMPNMLHQEQLFSTAAAASPLGAAPFASSAAANDRRQLDVAQWLAAQQQQGGGTTAAADNMFNHGGLYSSATLSNQYQPNYLRGAFDNLGYPSTYAQNLYPGVFRNAAVQNDPLSILRRELAANSAQNAAAYYPEPIDRLQPPRNAASAYLDFLAQRQPQDVFPASLGTNPLDNLSASTIEALLARRNMFDSSDSAASQNQTNQHMELLNHGDSQSLGLGQYLPSFAQAVDRADANRLLAGHGVGAPNEMAVAGSQLSRNLSTEPSEGQRQEVQGKAKGRQATADTSKKDDKQLNVPWDELVTDSALSLPEHRGMVSDVHLAVLAQMKPCSLSHEDRVGLYKTREIGFPGICCKHCEGVPGFGRYFPGSLTSLVNGNICASIIKHINEECRVCPASVRESILKLERHDELHPFHYKRGSRRQFFTHVWNRIQQGPNQRSDARVGGDMQSLAADKVDTIREQDVGDDFPWEAILHGSDIVQMEDRHLVPDTIFAATAQTKPCQVTEADRVGRCKDHKLGSMGLCCKHCGGKEGAFGRYFPSNLHTFAQVEVCKQIVKHITKKCLACPPEIRDAIINMQQLEKTLPTKRFPSRMVFFRRVWYRFHYDDNLEGGDVDEGSEGGETKRRSGEDTIVADDIPWDRLVKDSTLVALGDRGLICDSQFAAITQMDKCTLTEEDRIGYNKNRNVGFVGLCCRYCGGRPGFGRYFPNTVRNFEKTSARDTIVSHVSLFCQKCPDDIRSAILSLKRIESSRDGSATMKALIYGSGKLFFRRVWSKLHSEGYVEDEDSKPTGKGKAASSTSHAVRASRDNETSSSKENTDDSDDEFRPELNIKGKGRKRTAKLSSSETKKRRRESP
jgi:hypothetical protein